MALNRDEFQVLADTHYDDENYDTPDQRSFSMLVDLASHVYQQYTEHNKVDLDDPDSFGQNGTMGNVNVGWAMIQGLIENLEIHHPDAYFREMLPPNYCGHQKLPGSLHCGEMICPNYIEKHRHDENGA